MFFYDDWEKAEQDLLCRLFPNTDLFVNVGANLGYYCLLSLSHDVKSIAFEPDPMNYELLITNLELNNIKNNIVVNFSAVSDKVGLTEIYGMWTTVSLVRGFHDGLDVPRTVPAVRLDDSIMGSSWISGRTVILIDVEGWEANVLRGAQNVLQLDPRPIWIIEVLPPDLNPDGSTGDFHSTFEQMYESGYRSYRISPDGSLPEIPNSDEALRASSIAAGINYLFIDKNLTLSDVL